MIKMEYILLIIVGFSVGYTVTSMINKVVEIYQYSKLIKELEEKLDARLEKDEVK